MQILILMVHLLVCFSLILVVLLQSGKGGGLAGAFGGGGGSQALFGGRGAATFLSKSTAVLGCLFMLTSLALALLSGAHRASEPDSLMRKAQQEQEAPQPLPFATDTPAETPAAVPLPAGSGSATPAGSAQPAPAQSQVPGQSPAPGQTQTPASGVPQSPPAGGQ